MSDWKGTHPPLDPRRSGPPRAAAPVSNRSVGESRTLSTRPPHPPVPAPSPRRLTAAGTAAGAVVGCGQLNEPRSDHIHHCHGGSPTRLRWAPVSPKKLPTAGGGGVRTIQKQTPPPSVSDPASEGCGRPASWLAFAQRKRRVSRVQCGFVTRCTADRDTTARGGWGGGGGAHAEPAEGHAGGVAAPGCRPPEELASCRQRRATAATTSCRAIFSGVTGRAAGCGEVDGAGSVRVRGMPAWCRARGRCRQSWWRGVGVGGGGASVGASGSIGAPRTHPRPDGPTGADGVSEDRAKGWPPPHLGVRL